MFSRIKFEKTCSTKCGDRRQAFSVVGVKNMACPAIPKRRRKSSVSATFCLSPLPEIGEGLGEWSEAPSYEEGVGGDGEQQGFALQNVYSLLEKLEKERKADGAVVGALDVGVDEGVGEMGTETIGDDEIINTPTGVLLTRLKTV